MMEDGNSSHKQYTRGHDGVGSDIRYLSVFLYPVWKYIEKYLSYEDVLNLGSTNMYTRMLIYSLCTKLKLRDPNYYDGQKVCDSESPEFVINQFTSITSLKISPDIMRFDFLKNKNLNNLRYINLSSKYFSIARQCLPMSLTELQIYKFGNSNESYKVVFDDIEAFKQLRKLYICWEYIDDKSLTYLPESLQYLHLLINNSKNHMYNLNIAHLVNLKELHCALNKCYTIKLPSNLEKLFLSGFSELKVKNLDLSYLNHLKKLDLRESDITNIILPLSLVNIKITFCLYLTKLNIPNLINLKKIDCNINMSLCEINLPYNNLKKLRISNCRAIKKINISHLINLKTLELNLMFNLASLTLPPALMDIFIIDCNIRIINEKEIIFDFERPYIKLYSHTIRIRERWEITDYKIKP